MPAFRALDVGLPERFAEQAALALQVARAREDRERLAVFEDRDRIGRDLHDLVIQRLFAIGLGLENTARLARAARACATGSTSAVDDIDATIKDIRRSIFALSVADRVRGPAGRGGRAGRAGGRSLEFRPSAALRGPGRQLRHAPTSPPHLLAVLGEALSNAARHAEATHVWVQRRGRRAGWC